MDISDLPLFPLELVLYPGEATSLHIFEERYKLMVRDCVREKRPFGIVLFEEGKMADVGCEAQIREVLRRYPDGRMDITVVGQRRFRIEQVIDQKAYMQCEATVLTEPDEPLDSDSVERLITQHMKLLEVAGHEVRPTVYQDVDRLSFFIGRNAGLSLRQRQELLERESENARISFLVGFLEDFIPQVQQMEETRIRIRSNGHFKDFPKGEEGVD